MKYIDANTLRAKITDLCTNANFYQQKAMEESNKEDFVSSGGEIFAYAKVLSLIDSLQQEQPELQPIGYAETYYQKGLYDGIIKGRIEILKGLEEIEKRKADPILIINGQEHPEVFDSVAFQKGVQEGRRLEREDVKSIIQSRIDEILGDAQPNPILRMELNELIKKIEA